MAQSAVISSQPRKYLSLPLFNMKKLVKNCKKVFTNYNVQEKAKLSTKLCSQPLVYQRCLSEEEHQNWLNERMESQQLLIYQRNGKQGSTELKMFI